jgi:hypothetical protein
MQPPQPRSLKIVLGSLIPSLSPKDHPILDAPHVCVKHEFGKSQLRHPTTPIYPGCPWNLMAAIDKEKPANCYQRRAFRTIKISLDFQVVPEAGLEPAQGCPRGILSPLRLPIPPLRQRIHFKSHHEDLASRQTKKPANDPHVLGLLAGLPDFPEFSTRRRRRIARSRSALIDPDGKPGSRKAAGLAPPSPQAPPYPRVHPRHRAGFAPRGRPYRL